MRIAFVPADSQAGANAALAVLAYEAAALSPEAKAVNEATGGAIARAAAGGRFIGAKGQVLDILAPAGLDAARVVVIGVDGSGVVEPETVEIAAAHAYGAVKTSGVTELLLKLGGDAETAARVAFGVKLAAYRFDKYRTTEKAEKKPSVATIKVAAADPAKAQKAFAALEPLADAILFSRDLVSEPANILHPEEFAARVKGLESLGLEVEILGEAQMAELGMGSLLGVGQGSVRESQLVVVKWTGAADKSAQPIAFVGKGVCFDTGGISIKPAEGMEDMKWDMGGAAAVAGVMHALAGRKAKVNAIGVLGLVENMPDGAAQRPGDVVTSMSGQTIEVINTDAEGRLVLADALWYTQEHFKPKFMIDLATLTGAIIISLGNDYAGLFSNNDGLSEKLLAAGEAEREPLWRLPLPKAYEKQIESPIADLTNLGGRAGGSITAALFLQHFVGGLPWAHLDIASTAWRKGSTDPTVPDGAAGFGVRLLNRLVADTYEG
ncbi:leucyl aminopeptidase [Caulobacter sp.]|uniref:leucyl aminopeptidase n=1 Tax=Caulobacter sp. TaxID=78 RepID=UPI0031DDC4FF